RNSSARRILQTRARYRRRGSYSASRVSQIGLVGRRRTRQGRRTIRDYLHREQFLRESEHPNGLPIWTLSLHGDARPQAFSRGVTHCPRVFWMRLPGLVARTCFGWRARIRPLLSADAGTNSCIALCTEIIFWPSFFLFSFPILKSGPV